MILPGEQPSLGISDEHAFLKFVQLYFGKKEKPCANNLRTIVPGDHVINSRRLRFRPRRARRTANPRAIRFLASKSC